MQILKFPHPMLFQRCRDVTVFGEELAILLEAMKSTMISAKGVGLSANQVGLDMNCFVMLIPDGTRLSIINPVVIKRSSEVANIPEGCLSAPGETVTLTERVQWIQLKFQDETGAEQVKVFKGLYSVIVDHEMDHLAGRSFLQSKSVKKEKRKEFAKKYGK